MPPRKRSAKIQKTTRAAGAKTHGTTMAQRITTHPGEILRLDFMASLRITPPALAAAIGVPLKQLAPILEQKRPVTADIALRLAQYFGTTPDFWLNLQIGYDLYLAEGAHGDRVAQIQPWEWGAG
jgi:addiction module HigA family antidote